MIQIMKLKQSHKKQTEINYKTQFPINLILKDKIEKKKKQLKSMELMWQACNPSYVIEITSYKINQNKL